MHAGACGVQRELSHRDAHATGSLVAQPQDPLVVGGNDQPDARPAGVAEQFGDAINVVGSDPHAARTALNVAERATRFAYRRGVDDRGEFLDVVDEQPVEERLVAIVQRNESDVLLQIISLAADMLELKLHLLLDGGHAPGQQPAKAELIPFRIGERDILVQARLIKYSRAARQRRRGGRRGLAAAGVHLAS